MKTITHVVSHGARTPVGFTAEGTAAAVRAKICRVELQTDMIDRTGAPIRFARDATLDPQVRGPERFFKLFQ